MAHEYGDATPLSDSAALTNFDGDNGTFSERRGEPKPNVKRYCDNRVRNDITGRSMHGPCDLRLRVRRDERDPKDYANR